MLIIKIRRVPQTKEANLKKATHALTDGRSLSIDGKSLPIKSNPFKELTVNQNGTVVQSDQNKNISNNHDEDSGNSSNEIYSSPNDDNEVGYDNIRPPKKNMKVTG